MKYRPGYWEGERDPGNERYYAAGRAARDQAREVLEPALFAISSASFLVGRWTIFWSWGKSETGMAFGQTVEDAIADADRQVFKGL
jgi:hypothetical protein